MKRKLKLSELRFDDDLLRMRPINDVTVGRYRQAYRLGRDLGVIVVDADTNTVVVGNHRSTALISEFGDDHEITVNAVKFKTRAELIERFAQSNTEHGMPLSGLSRRMIAHELIRLDVPVERVAQLFNVPIRSVEHWGEIAVTLVGGKSGSTTTAPIKRGLHVPGGRMGRADYETHLKRDRGVPVLQQCEQLTRWLRNGWVDTENARHVAALRELREAIDAAVGDVVMA